MTIQFMLPLEHSSDALLTAESIRLAHSIWAKRTLTDYASDWRIFSDWCVTAGRAYLPATTNTVSLYLTDLLCKQRKINTARRHMCAIVHYHRQVGYDSPCTPDVYAILTGAQRLRGEQPQQKIPISVEQLRQMIRLVNRPEPSAARDRAVLLFGFATALRRSNIVALDMADIEFTDRGMLVKIRREKQDQTGIGRTIGVPFGQNAETCPIRTMKTWLSYRGDRPGSVFCSTHNSQIRHERHMHHNVVAQIVKRGVESIGLDSSSYAGHSLRSGFVTAALESGVGEILTAQHTGHRSLATLKRYMRPQDPFRANACSALGL